MLASLNAKVNLCEAIHLCTLGAMFTISDKMRHRFGRGSKLPALENSVFVANSGSI